MAVMVEDVTKRLLLRPAFSYRPRLLAPAVLLSYSTRCSIAILGLKATVHRSGTMTFSPVRGWRGFPSLYREDAEVAKPLVR